MLGSQLHLRYDQTDHVVWVEAICPDTGQRERESVQLREGFELEHVRQALLVTDRVSECEGNLWLDRATRCAVACELVEQLLDYLATPDEPGPILREVQAAVAATEEIEQADVKIPLLAYAWADMMVREDVADEARGAKGLWTDPTLVIELESRCHQRVTQLCRQYARHDLRMSPSTRARRSKGGDSRTG